MWKNKRGGNNSSDWRGKGRTFSNNRGNSRHGGTNTFNRRQTPDRIPSLLDSDFGGRQLDNRSMGRHVEDVMDRRELYEDNRQVVDRSSRIYDDDNCGGPLVDQFVNDYPERDKNIYAIENDLYNPDYINENRNQYGDRRDDFDGDHGQDRLYNNDREFDNVRYRTDEYDRGDDIKFEVPFDERRDGDNDRWKAAPISKIEDKVNTGIYDQQSYDRKEYGDRRDTTRNYGDPVHVKSEPRNDRHQSSSGFKHNIRSAPGARHSVNDRRDTRTEHDRPRVDNSPRQSNRRHNLDPIKQENSRSGHSSKTEDRRHDATSRQNDTRVKQGNNQLNKPLKTETTSKSGQSGRTTSSSRNNDNKRSTTSSAASSRHDKSLEPSRESKDRVNKQSDQRRSGSGSQKDEHKIVNSKDDRNKSSSSRTGQNNSSQSRSGSKEDRKRSSSNQDTRDSNSRNKSNTNNDNFKKPSDRQQPNTVKRSNSGRRNDTDFSHNDDDILSIMADDDGFEFGSLNTSSTRQHGRDTESRHQHDRDSYQRQNSKNDLDRSMEPVFEIHADCSASIFEDTTEKHRSSGQNERSRPSSSRDHSKERRSSGTKRSGSSSKDRQNRDRSSDKAERHRESGRHSREELGKTGAVLRDDRSGKSGAVLRDDRSVNSGAVLKDNRSGKTGAVLRDDRTGKSGAVLRDDRLGKSGAVLRDDRSGKTGTGIREDRPGSSNIFKSRSQGYSNQFIKPKFRGTGFSNPDKVRRKYFGGGLKSSGYDRGISRHKGNYDGRSTKAREDRKSGINNRSKVNDNRNLRTASRKDKNDVNIGEFPLNHQVDPNQQIVFIPNQESGVAPMVPQMVPQMVDQFGRVIYDADLQKQSMEGQIPIQYLPEQYPGEGSAVGEQIVFIPFNQMPNYSDNIANSPVNDSTQGPPQINDKHAKKPQITETQPSNSTRSKPLSRLARANLRKRLAAKRKQRLEEEIERKVLKKIFENPDLAQAVMKREEREQVKKKPVIRRISPPTGNKPTHAKKTFKLVKKTSEAIEVSDEEAENYDDVSDLEDVTDDDDDEKRRDKRPVFRKPGQPRRGNNKPTNSRAKDSDDDGRSHDIRRVVQSSSNQGRNDDRGQKRQRSVYEEDSRRNTSNQGQTSQYGRKKNKRSISPIEITVSNEKYSKMSSNRQQRQTKSSPDNRRRRNDNESNNERRSGSRDNRRFENDDDDEVRDQHRSGGNNDTRRSGGGRNRDEEDNRRNTHAQGNPNKSNQRHGSGPGKYNNRNEEEHYPEQGRNTGSKFGSGRDNNYRPDHQQSEWDNNSQGNRRFGNKNQGRNNQHGNFDDVDMDISPDRQQGAPNYYTSNKNTGNFRGGNYQANPSFSQQQQSIDKPMYNQGSFSMSHQFNKTGPGVDHSLPPVQNIQQPPFPPSSHNVDMSLPPPVGGIGHNSNMMPGSNTGNYPQNYGGIQSQQQFHSMQQQFPQQMQSMQQGQSQYPMQQQSMYNQGIGGQNQMGIQHMQQNQFQQTNVGMPQNLMSDQMSSGIPSLNQGNFKPVIKPSNSPQAFVATNSQGVRGVLGTLKTTGSSIQSGLRMSQVETGPQGLAAVGIADIKQSPGQGKLPQSGEAYFDDLVQMICSKCNTVMLDHGMMKAHGRWHDMIESNNKNWRCDQCEQAFPSSASYSEHMSDKHTYNSWNCSLCNLSFVNSSALNKHVRHSTHKNLKVKFICSLCPASFMVLTHLIQHKKEIHQSSTDYTGYRKY